MPRPKKSAAAPPPLPPPDGDDADPDAAPKPAAATAPKLKLPAPPPPRARAQGQSVITLVKTAVPSQWVVPPDGELVVTFEIGNTGGKLDGLYVEIGGPGAGAIPGGTLACDGTSGVLEQKGATLRGELPKLAIEAGFADDGGQKPPLPLHASSRPLEIRLRARSKSAGLVTVRIGPLKAPPGRGSVVQGRQLTAE